MAAFHSQSHTHSYHMTFPKRLSVPVTNLPLLSHSFSVQLCVFLTPFHSAFRGVLVRGCPPMPNWDQFPWIPKHSNLKQKTHLKSAPKGFPLQTLCLGHSTMHYFHVPKLLIIKLIRFFNHNKKLKLKYFSML